MKASRFSAFLIMALAVILGVQLTGVSCLEDWHLPMASDVRAAFHTAGITAGLLGLEESIDDGCPCHLAFISVKTGSRQMISPVILSAISLPNAPPIPWPFTLFHTPLQA